MMSKKKSKKKKRLPSSPSGSEQETSQVQDGTRKHKSPKMTQPGSSLHRPAEVQKKDGPPSGQPVSESSPRKDRRMKKAVYRLTKTPGSDQTPAEKEEARVKRKSCFSQATSSVPGRGDVFSPGKTPERRLSESLGTPVALKEQKRSSLMKRPSPQQPSKDEEDSRSTKIQEELREKRRRQDRRRCQEREEVLTAKRKICTGAQLSSASPVRRTSSTYSAKNSASPVRRTSSTYSARTSASPVRRTSSTYSGRTSASPVRRTSSTYSARTSSSPVRRTSSTYSGRTSASPVRRTSSTYSARTSSSPVRRTSSTYSGRTSASPVRRTSSTYSARTSASPVRRTSSTYSGRTSASPVRRTSSTYSGRTSASPVRRTSSTYSAKNSASPVRRTSSTYSAKNSASPVRRTSSTYSARTSASPVRRTSSTYSGRTSASPVRITSSTYSGRTSASPGRRTSSTYSGRTSASPVRRTSSTYSARTSASPVRSETSTYSGRTSASPVRRISSPYSTKNSASPVRSESSTYSTKNSASPVKRTSSTYSTKNSASPVRREPSTYSTQTSASPVRRTSSTYSAKNSASPVRSETSTYSDKNFVSPVRREPSTYSTQTSASPVRSETSTYSAKNSASPVRSETSTYSDKNFVSPVRSETSTYSDKNFVAPVRSETSTYSDKSSASPVRSKPSTECLTPKQWKRVKPSSTEVEITPTKSAVPFSFKIPKKIKPVALGTAIRKGGKNTSFTANAKTEYLSTVSHVRGPEPSDTGSSAKRAKEGPLPDVLCPAVVSSTPQLERKGDGSTVSCQSTILPCNNTSPWIAQTLIKGDGPSETTQLYGNDEETLIKGDGPSETTQHYENDEETLIKGDGSSETTQLYENDEEMQLVEVLHLARSENRLEVELVGSYGELTCMDIDLPADTPGPLSSHSSECPEQNVIVVLDTNILLSHLDYVKNITYHGFGALGSPVVLIPWVVLQELDSLKNGRRLSGSVAHLAAPAVHFIYCSLKSQQPRLWGQSMQQAAQSNYGLNAENNDDRVLQCCLQYQHLNPGGALILCTNDKNLCSKAMLSGVKAFSKADLEAEVEGCTAGLPSPLLTHSAAPWSQAHALNQTCTQTQNKRGSGICPGPWGNEEAVVNWRRVNEGVTEEDKERKELAGCVSVLEDCLKEALSVILEEEMKAAYEDLWKDIVIVKPPWTLKDILQCLKKHWIAVFGVIVTRNQLQTVLNLTDFLYSGKTVDGGSMVMAVCEAQELLQAFGRRSLYGGRVPSALSSLDGLIQKLLPQPERVKECPLGDAVMCEDEQKLATPPGVSQQEVWSLFENMWNRVCDLSSTVFAALGFDPSTKLQISQSEGGPPPPQDALACLYKLSSTVAQLLHVLSRVLSPESGLEESQELLSFIHSSEIVVVETMLSAKDLLECFSQQEYREKLRIGGCQLTELKVSLECCTEAVSRRVTHATWP